MTDNTRSVAQEPLLLADLSSPETQDLLPRIELVLVPVGAHEQHGPNIAVSTDTISADALCRATAALIGRAVAVAPGSPGASPGTTSASSAPSLSVSPP